jgi:hypothetical protein
LNSGATGTMGFTDPASFAPASGIALTALANQAVYTILANATNGAAAPTAVVHVDNGIWGCTAAGVCGYQTSISMDNSAAQFYDSVAPTKYVKIDPVGVTASKTATVAFSNTNDATYTFPVTGGTVALTTGTVERIGATFDGGGSAVAVNKVAYAHIPYAISTINQWTVQCAEDSGVTGIIITPYLDAYAADTHPTTTMCTTGTPPHTTDGAGAGGKVHQAAWDCNITAIPADSIIMFKVTTAPTDSTWCTVTLKVTR